MNIGLFAGGNVGCKVARLLRRSGKDLQCVAVDGKDKTGFREKIIRASGLTGDRVFFSDRLDSAGSLRRLRKLNLDLVILAWWPYIVGKGVREIPRLGCLNFHPSLLPYNRGKHYNFWALVEEAPFGVTLHFADAAVDAGDIAFQSEIAVSWEDTGKILYEKAQKEIVELFRRSLPAIRAGDIPRRAQDPGQGSFHRSAELEPASEINLDREYTARRLLNLLRARTFPPHPAARFSDAGETYEVRVEIRKVKRSPGADS